MPEENESLWDPRPRLAREADRVGADGEAEHEAGEEQREPETDDPASSPGPSAAGSVLVELRAARGMSPASALDVARRLDKPGFDVDEEFGAMPLGGDSGERTYVVRGRVADDAVVSDLEGDPRVAKVWGDTPVAPF